MGEYVVLIDDGRAVASSAASRYKSVDAAMADTVRTAAEIAVDLASSSDATATIRCEVLDRLTGIRKAKSVTLRIEPEAPSNPIED